MGQKEKNTIIAERLPQFRVGRARLKGTDLAGSCNGICDIKIAALR
jgi:hypothetical protein